jgi:hypothetical protein
LTWIILQYVWYHDCGYNNVIISITVIASIAFYAIVFFKTREDASILTSSVVVLYINYLQWSALASNPNEECNPFSMSATNTIMQIVLGLIFTVFSLLIISSATKKTDSQNFTTRINSTLMEDEEDGFTTRHNKIDSVTKKDGQVLT